MNIFVLSTSPHEAAKLHCDKHVVKMIIEYAQLLSTAHRVLDGTKTIKNCQNKSGKMHKKTTYRLAEVEDNMMFYAATHVNHPCAIWARESAGNYTWLYNLFTALCDEYTHRYGKIHLTDKFLRNHLINYPKNMIIMTPMTPFVQCMNSAPECKNVNVDTAYRQFYMTKQSRMKMAWTNRKQPAWFQQHNTIT